MAGPTFHPGCGQDFLGAEVMVHFWHGDALQLLHLLLEDGRIPGLALVVQLVEESAGPLIDDTGPICLVLHCSAISEAGRRLHPAAIQTSQLEGLEYPQCRNT